MIRINISDQLRRGWAAAIDLGKLQEDLDQLFEKSGLGTHLQELLGKKFPPVNLTTDDHGSTLHAELPGVDLKDLEITLVGTTLTLKGERNPGSARPEQKVHMNERSAGSFTRNVELPHRVDPDAVEARLQNGILVVRLPMATELKPRNIEIKD